jgi:hypothetical protein
MFFHSQKISFRIRLWLYRRFILMGTSIFFLRTKYEYLILEYLYWIGYMIGLTRFSSIHDCTYILYIIFIVDQISSKQRWIFIHVYDIHRTVYTNLFKHGRSCFRKNDLFSDSKWWVVVCQQGVDNRRMTFAKKGVTIQLLLLQNQNG